MSIIGDLPTEPIFFVTQQSVGREPVLSNEMMMRLLQAALQQAKARYSYERIGYLLLPDQIQLLLSPRDNSRLDQIMQQMRQSFQMEYRELLHMRGTTLLWEEQYAARRVQETAELAAYLDHMHYQPVQLGLVARPEAWPYSSFALWQKRGVYPPRWGWIDIPCD